MSKFRVGEIVTVKHDLKSGQPFGDEFNVTQDMEKLAGKKVKIKAVNPTHYGDSYKIEGSSRWWRNECFEENQKILITHDGTTTLARLYEGKKVVQSAEAKCAPSDTFDFVVGAKLAFERLVGNQDKPTEQPKEPVKLYCVKDYCGYLKKGKVYEFDGHRVNYDGIRCAYHHDYNAWKNNDPSFAECLVPLVKRPAKVGEWVYVVDSGSSDYEANKIYKVFQTGFQAKYVWFAPDGKGYVKLGEYLVLDGYAPKTCDKCGEILE